MDIKKGVAFSDNSIFNEPDFETTGETRHTFKDWGMFVSSKEIGVPLPKTNKVDVWGRDGVIDLSADASGAIRYGERKLSIDLLVPDGDRKWSAALTKVTDFLHGKMKYIKFDDAPEWVYRGRCFVDSIKTARHKGIISITCECEPYKVERYWKVRHHEIDGVRVSDWIWDAFSFVDGYVWNNVWNCTPHSGGDDHKLYIPADNTAVTFNANVQCEMYIWDSNLSVVFHETFTGGRTVTLNRGEHEVYVQNDVGTCVVQASWQARAI